MSDRDAVIYGPCPENDCDGAPERYHVGHGGDLWKCPECGIRFQAIKGGVNA